MAPKYAKAFVDRIPGVMSDSGTPLLVAGRDPGSNIILVLEDGSPFLDGSRKVTIHKSVLIPCSAAVAA